MKRIRKLAISLLTLALALTLAAPAAFAAETYKDIQGAWYEKWAASYGYAEIFSDRDGSFRANQAVTRMEFARLLHRALGIQIYYFAATDIGDFYDDVANDSAGAGDLYDLVTLGIVDTKGSFRPDGTLDRDEMVRFVMNAFYHFTGESRLLLDLAQPPFTDGAEIRAEYLDDVIHAALLGLVTGRGGNMLHPRDASTRAEAVTLVGRLAELLKQHASDVAVTASAREENGGLVMTLAIRNDTDKTVTITHSSGQKYDFTIWDAGGDTLYRWSADRVFTMAITKTPIAPGGEVVFSETFDAASYAPIRDKIAAVRACIVGVSPDFSIDPDGYLAA